MCIVFGMDCEFMNIRRFCRASVAVSLWKMGSCVEGKVVNNLALL